MIDRSDNFHTVDGVRIVPNLRVFGYDGVWGNVDPCTWSNDYGHPDGEFFDGWYRVVWDNGRKDIANGTRMITRTPLSTDPTPDKRV